MLRSQMRLYIQGLPRRVMVMFGLMATGIGLAAITYAVTVTGHAREPAEPGCRAPGSITTGDTTGKGAPGEGTKAQLHILNAIWAITCMAF